MSRTLLTYYKLEIDRNTSKNSNRSKKKEELIKPFFNMFRSMNIFGYICKKNKQYSRSRQDSSGGSRPGQIANTDGPNYGMLDNHMKPLLVLHANVVVSSR